MLFFQVTLITLYIIAALLHAFGFILLLKIVRKRCSTFDKSQRIYLLFISFIQLVGCIALSLMFVPADLDPTWNSTSYYIYTYLRTSGFVKHIGSMLLLTVDRVLVANLNLRYPIFITIKKIVYSMVIVVFLGLTYFAIVLILELDNGFIQKFIAFSSIIFSALVLLCYLWILHIINSSKRKLHKINKDGPTPNASKIRFGYHLSMKKTLAVPFLIFFTFVIFYAVPFQITYWKGEIDLYAPQRILHPLGFISDAVIYIFFEYGWIKEDVYHFGCSDIHLL